MKEARQKLYIIPFISCYKICKLINNKFCMKMGVGGGERVGRTTNKCEETFACDAQFHYLDCDDGFTIMHMYVHTYLSNLMKAYFK